MTLDPFRWLRVAAYFALLCLCLAFLKSAHAQTAVIPFASPNVQFFDGNGNPLASGCVFTYQAGTTTPLTTYTDSAGTVANTNPIILDASGTATIWFSMSAYKYVVKSFGGTACASGSTIKTVDNISEKFIRTDAGNVMTPTVDPAASLGLFWLSSTTPYFLKWSDSTTIHTVVDTASAQTLTNKTLTSPNINSPNISFPTVTTPTESNPIFTQGVYPDASGFKHARTVFTSANPSVDVTVTWGTAFANTSYTPVCQVSNGSADTTGWETIGKSASALVVRVFSTGVHAGLGLDCIAVHD